MNTLDLSDQQIIDLAIKNEADFGCDGIEKEIRSSYAENNLHIVRHFNGHGFAIVVKSKYDPGYLIWLLWISKKYRKMGSGKQLMAQLATEFSGTYFLRLICYGVKRARFFESCGYTVFDKKNARYEMQGPAEI